MSFFTHLLAYGVGQEQERARREAPQRESQIPREPQSAFAAIIHVALALAVGILCVLNGHAIHTLLRGLP
jgi:hypothetical protein